MDIPNEVRVFDVAFSPNNNFVAIAGYDGSVTIWDLISKERIGKYSHRFKANSLDFSFDNRLLASASFDGTIKIWDMSKLTVLSTIEYYSSTGTISPIYSIDFSEDNKMIVTGMRDISGTVRVWDARSGEEIASVYHGAPIGVVIFSPDGNTFFFKWTGWYVSRLVT